MQQANLRSTHNPVETQGSPIHSRVRYSGAEAPDGHPRGLANQDDEGGHEND